jgi:hypothetical protein
VQCRDYSLQSGVNIIHKALVARICVGQHKLKLKLIYDRRSVGQSVLVSGSHLEPMTRFLFSV